MPHRFPVRVRFNELDPYKHVNHPVYLTYCEAARIQLLDDVGWDMGRLEEKGYRIVVVDMEIRFLRSAELGEDLVVETEVVEVKRVSSRWRQRILGGAGVYLELTLGAAVTDLEGKPVRIPDGFAEAFEAYQAGLVPFS